MERTEARSTLQHGNHGAAVEWHPPLGDRVRAHTGRRSTQRIDRDTQASLEQLARGSLLGILRRLHDLDREWDLDRALMVTFAALGGGAAAMSIREVARAARPGPWTGLFAAQLGFLVLYAVRGWCPPVIVLRRLGFRTRQEIEAERSALEQVLDDRLGG